MRSSPWLAGWGWHSDGIFGQQHAEAAVHASVQRLFLVLSWDSSTEVSQKRTPSTKMYEHGTVFHTFLKCLIRLFGGMTPNSALYQEWWSLVRSDCIRLRGPVSLCLHCKTWGIRPANSKNNSNTKQIPNKQTKPVQLEKKWLALGKGCSKPSLAGLKIDCFCVVAVFGILLVSMQKPSGSRSLWLMHPETVSTVKILMYPVGEAGGLTCLNSDFLGSFEIRLCAMVPSVRFLSLSSQ